MVLLCRFKQVHARIYGIDRSTLNPKPYIYIYTAGPRKWAGDVSTGLDIIQLDPTYADVLVYIVIKNIVIKNCGDTLLTNPVNYDWATGRQLPCLARLKIVLTCTYLLIKMIEYILHY